MPTSLVELMKIDQMNFESTSTFLGEAAYLRGDLEDTYNFLTPLLSAPSGSVLTSDEKAAWTAITFEFQNCRLLLTKGAFSVLKLYQGEAMTYVRRAIEACAFAVRISKHQELGRIWLESGLADDKYNGYRKQFRPRDVFPDSKHIDHDPRLDLLKQRFDDCSKQIHGSMFGIANHVGDVTGLPDGTTTRFDFCDLKEHSIVATYFFVLHAHEMILGLFGEILEPYMTDKAAWTKEFGYVHDKVLRHTQSRWSPSDAPK